jgi:hypothetical protein
MEEVAEAREAVVAVEAVAAVEEVWVVRAGRNKSGHHLPL